MNELIQKREVGKTGLKIPTLGMGCASLGNLYRAISNEQASEVVTKAWEDGLRYFDTAPHYGQGLSERRLGDSLRQFGSETYVLSSKVGRLLKPAGYAKERHGFISPMPFDIHYDYSYDGILRSFEDSLTRLGLDKIDILYIHDIGKDTHGDKNDEYFPIAMDGGLRALERLKNEGVVKAIGLGVNESEVCISALDYGDWDCFLLAGRYTLLEQGALDVLLPKCIEQNCSVVVGGPYNSGILAVGTRGQNIPKYNYEDAPDEVIAKVKKIEEVCSEYEVTMAAAALQFPLAHPAVSSVIPGISSCSRLAKTIELFEEKIPSEFWVELARLNILRPDVPLPNEKGII